MKSAWLDGPRVRQVELVPLGDGRYRVTVDQSTFDVGVEVLEEGRLRLTNEQGAWVIEVTRGDRRRFVRVGRSDFVLERADVARASRSRANEDRLESPMPGVVTKVLVAEGEDVRKGQALLAVEAMKMEHLIRAPRDGRVSQVRARAGEMVNGGVPLVELAAVES
ncbi:MAG TPA: biotin/lipoyl-containing protein [Candidatus Eisenbacteria bacterium]|nr:biotin/lipoyl-containing protein [Candidatus Eisenbacteria bacterium]